MNKDLKLMSGYQGEDSMRKKAENLLRTEMASTPKEFPSSMSASSREKVRLYAKGGSVKHGLTKEQTDLVLPTRRKGEYSSDRSLTAAQAMKKGGDVKTPMLSVQSMSEAEKMKKGGKCYAKGGPINYEKGMRGESASSKPPAPKSKKMSGQMDASNGQYKKMGGSIKKKYATGGPVNYESEMMGTTPKSRVPSPQPKESGFDASHGEYKEKGFKRGGPAKRFAAGGAGKVRKGMATKQGLIAR